MEPRPYVPRLAQLGAPTAEVLEPSAGRRLVLAAVEDDCEAEGLVATFAVRVSWSSLDPTVACASKRGCNTPDL